MRPATSICVVLALALVPAVALAAKARKARPHTVYPRPAPAEQAAPQPPAPDALQADIDKVLQAMMGHDPSKAPLAPDVRYTENGQALAPGQGLWRTATAIAMEGDGLANLGLYSSAYRLYFEDPSTGQAAYFGAFTDQGVPGMMMLRLKAAGGKISEIETVVVRKDAAGAFDPRGFSQPEPVLLAGGERWAPEIMAAAANRYFDGVAKRSSAGVPFSADCIRRDNGVQTTTPAQGCAAQLDAGAFGRIAQVRRRILVIDEDRGLVMAAAMVDHAAEPPPPSDKKRKKDKHAVPATPPPTLSTELFGVIFKMSDGKITRIEAIGRPAANDAALGWN